MSDAREDMLLLY